MIVVHILLTITGFGLMLVTLPLMLELIGLSVAALLPARPTAASASTPLRLAVIVPAHNEEKLVGACVASLRASGSFPATVFVVAHNCSDQTARIAAAAGAEVLVRSDDGTGGKGTALNYGFDHAIAAGYEAVLVIDADSVVSPNLTFEVAAALSAGAAAVQCRYMVANAQATERTRLMSLAFLGMNVLRPRGRSRLGFSCGIFGNGFALAASTLRQVPYAALSVVEDLEYHLLLIRAGLRVDFIDTARVLGEMPDNNAASATQRARWEGGRLLMRREYTSILLMDVLRGRLRFLEPLLDLRSLPLGSEVMLLAVALLIPLGWLRLYALTGLAGILLYVLVSAGLSDDPGAMLRALVSVPKYLLFKLALRGRIKQAGARDAEWVRTERN